MIFKKITQDYNEKQQFSPCNLKAKAPTFNSKIFLLLVSPKAM